jgi:hypothetical protein
MIKSFGDGGDTDSGGSERSNGRSHFAGTIRGMAMDEFS